MHTRSRQSGSLAVFHYSPAKNVAEEQLQGRNNLGFLPLHSPVIYYSDYILEDLQRKSFRKMNVPPLSFNREEQFLVLF